MSERLANLDKQRRAALAKISTVNTDLETARLKLAAARGKLRALGIGSPKSGSPTGSVYTLYREAGQNEGLKLVDEVELLTPPGDVVDVLSGGEDGPPRR